MASSNYGPARRAAMVSAAKARGLDGTPARRARERHHVTQREDLRVRAGKVIDGDAARAVHYRRRRLAQRPTQRTRRHARNPAPCTRTRSSLPRRKQPPATSASTSMHRRVHLHLEARLGRLSVLWQSFSPSRGVGARHRPPDDASLRRIDVAELASACEASSQILPAISTPVGPAPTTT